MVTPAKTHNPKVAKPLPVRKPWPPILSHKVPKSPKKGSELAGNDAPKPHIPSLEVVIHENPNVPYSIAEGGKDKNVKIPEQMGEPRVGVTAAKKSTGPSLANKFIVDSPKRPQQRKESWDKGAGRGDPKNFIVTSKPKENQVSPAGGIGNIDRIKQKMAAEQLNAGQGRNRSLEKQGFGNSMRKRTAVVVDSPRRIQQPRMGLFRDQRKVSNHVGSNTQRPQQVASIKPSDKLKHERLDQSTRRPDSSRIGKTKKKDKLPAWKQRLRQIKIQQTKWFKPYRSQ